MIMKRFILHQLVALIMVILIASGNLNGQDLSFTIKLDKTAYNKGEQISCTMMLKNISSKDLVVNNRFLVNRPGGPHEISFQIMDPGMKMVPFSSKVNASSKSKKFLVLHPGKTEIRTYILTEDFDLTETGNYNIAAFYENRVDAPASLKLSSSWKGNLISNKVNFTLR